jgi:hypothetical protein
MAAAMLVDDPNGSQEIYEGVRALLGVERPAGGICHLPGPSSKGGWSVIEVWESEEDARGFLKEGLLPAPEVVGVPAPLQPELWPVQPHVGQRTGAADICIPTPATCLGSRRQRASAAGSRTSFQRSSGAERRP